MKFTERHRGAARRLADNLSGVGASKGMIIRIAKLDLVVASGAANEPAASDIDPRLVSRTCAAGSLAARGEWWRALRRNEYVHCSRGCPAVDSSARKSSSV